MQHLEGSGTPLIKFRIQGAKVLSYFLRRSKNSNYVNISLPARLMLTPGLKF
jgi:hypothetical protein